ncbi:hypothetical protein GCM10009716_40330 [Streptomyces sodiiphilus]|uniref:Uncharacterized protein n=1 Tax=Streptomyces sodiiphilus TaxID=226217 RepID=A0ABN2PR91_9ACTN
MLFLLVLVWTAVLMVARRQARRAAARPVGRWLRKHRVPFSLTAGPLAGALNAVLAESAWGLVLAAPVAAAGLLALPAAETAGRGA